MKELTFNIKYNEDKKDDKAKIFDILNLLSEITEIKIEKKLEVNSDPNDIRYGITLISTQFANDNRSGVYGFHSKEDRDLIFNKLNIILNRKYEPEIDDIKDHSDFSNLLHDIDDIIESCGISYCECPSGKIENFMNITDFKYFAI